MVGDNGCMYVAKIESSMLTHQLPYKYACLHLGSALLLCAELLCVCPQPDHGRGGPSWWQRTTKHWAAPENERCVAQTQIQILLETT